MNYRVIGAFAFAVLALLPTAAGSLLAHHSAAAVYDLSKKLEFTGTITRLVWKNPHPEVFVDVNSGSDQTGAWRFELPTSPVSARNVKNDFVNAINQDVLAEIVPARDGSPNGLLLQITFAGGESVSFDRSGGAPTVTAR